MTSTLEGIERLSRLDRAVQGLAFAFAFAVPWANLIVFPLLGTGPRVIGILLTGLWAVSVLVNDGLRPLTRYHNVAYALVAWLGISVFWSPDRLHSLEAAIQYIQLFVLMVVIWNVFSTSQQLVRLKQAYVFGCWTTFAILAFNFLTGDVTEWERRATLTNSNSNEIGLLLSVALPIAWYLATSRDPVVRAQVGRLRVFNFLYIGAGLIGIMLTASRGSFISTVPFVVYLAASMRGQSLQRRALSGVLLSGLLIGASVFIPQTAWERIATIPQSIEDRDFGARYQIWSELFGFVFASVPNLLFGNGVSAADVLVKDAHNVLISVLVGTGVLGLALFVTLFGGVVRSAFALEAGKKAMWLAVLACYFVGSMAFSSDAHKVTWLFFGMVLAQRGVAVVAGGHQGEKPRMGASSTEETLVDDPENKALV